MVADWHRPGVYFFIFFILGLALSGLLKATQAKSCKQCVPNVFSQNHIIRGEDRQVGGDPTVCWPTPVLHCPSIEGAVNCRGEGKLLAPSTPSTARVACIRKVRALGPHHCSSRSGVQQLPPSPRSTCSPRRPCHSIKKTRLNVVDGVLGHAFSPTHMASPHPHATWSHTQLCQLTCIRSHIIAACRGWQDGRYNPHLVVP